VGRAAWLIEPAGLVPYDLANRAMHDLAARRLRGEVPDALVLLEHPPVFTAGRRARPEELLWSPDEVEARGGTVRRIDRGGSFTFHGPGQLVAYPIVDLGTRPDVGEYLRRLEGAGIAAAADLGVEVGRRPDVQTGVWAGEAKVAAIGVRLLRARVTLHGMALNCDADLSWFGGIVACGLSEHGVTSLSVLAGRRISVADAAAPLRRRLAETLELDLRRAPGSESDRFAPEVTPAPA
jgi:lipoyl(octanoyl) transferase